jgi:hypothetical protein
MFGINNRKGEKRRRGVSCTCYVVLDSLVWNVEVVYVIRVTKLGKFSERYDTCGVLSSWNPTRKYIHTANLIPFAKRKLIDEIKIEALTIL